MNRMRIFSALLTGAFIMAIAGAVISTYTVVIGDPFVLAGQDDDGPIDNKSDPSVPRPDDDPSPEDTDEGLPGYVYVTLSLAIGGAVVFLAGSGNLYLRSRRGENIVRADLLDLITVNPGINLSSIRRELQLSQGAVSYHIMKLEKLGKVYSDKGSKERRYYPSSMGYTAAMKQSQADEIGSILSNDTSRSIVSMLRERPMSQNEIVNELSVSPSTVHWHMERMKKAGLISKEQRGRSVYYELRDTSDRNT
ncbi:MAG: metalloregulator ArsR/SmtB family transcription factor [Candidatus Thermoplasmatota archaeon]|nr:metalloregulator ArsR/SmtB family transcription factor [Candidatus Thermoplasmatota archaeon]